MPLPLVPAKHQVPLPHERLIVREAPGDDAVPMDVVFVGGGPAGLSGAIELARLAQGDPRLQGLEIAVLEKSAELGQHTLSGAVVNPVGFHTLFPDLADADLPFRRPVGKEQVRFLTATRSFRLPTPPPMRNHGNFVASICEIVRWLGAKAEALGVHLFTGFPVESLLVEGDAVRGLRTTSTGLGRDGRPGPGHEPPTEIAVALAEGTRGPLAQAWREWQGVRSRQPQIFALGVKELWEVREPQDTVLHTLGWPLPPDVFGGTFCYPLEERLLALGIVVGLDAPYRNLDPHGLLQAFKTHPSVRPVFEGGECVEWGAKTIPEGGYHALPERLGGDGLLLLGDTAGFVDVPSLKGIHYAMLSGVFAARAIFRALSEGDATWTTLSDYDRTVRESLIAKDLERSRNMRQAFRSGLWRGGMKSSVMILTGGAFPRDGEAVEADAEVTRATLAPEPPAPDGRLTFRKVDAVYRSGNATRDDVPLHLVGTEGLPPAMEQYLEHVCPAGVYEAGREGLVVNAPNCVDCKATDVVGPRWTPREGGSGPRYKRM
jgi:electron-transferring-flavoprotein dehydrogenase